MELITSTKLTGHNGSIYALTVGEGKQFYSGAGDGWIAEWNLESGTDGRLVAEAEDQIFAIHKIANSPWILAGTMSGLLYFINTDFPDQIKSFDYHKDGIFALLHDKDRILVGGGDGRLSIWSMSEQMLLETVNLSSKRIRTLALSPDGQLLAAGCSDGCIYLLHMGSWKVLEIIKSAHLPSVFTLRFTSDGQQLISGGRDAHLKVWSVFEGFAMIQDLPAHWYTINALAIHHQGRILATASRDKTLRLWDLTDYSLIKTLDAQKNKGHINSVNDLCWSADGDHLISASDDRSIIVWYLGTLISQRPGFSEE